MIYESCGVHGETDKMMLRCLNPHRASLGFAR